MRKIITKYLLIFLSLLLFFSPIKGVNAETNKVYLGGMAAGFSLHLDGVQIVGFTEFLSDSETVSPAYEAGLKAGDLIEKIEDKSISSVKEIECVVQDGKPFQIRYVRESQHYSVSLTPKKDDTNGKYRVGFLIRDSIAGIGTVTCIKKDMKFGSLGHPVVNENRLKMNISDPNVYLCSIIGVNKGTKGKAGELKGVFLKNFQIGKANQNGNTGVFGQYNKNYLKDVPEIEIGNINDVKPGKAEIVTTIDGIQPRHYQIEIVKVDSNHPEHKNFIIHIIDKALIDETGGIVQGMSGSPILQKGKLIGAVTHVFLNDPTRGYGIGIEEMFENAA